MYIGCTIKELPSPEQRLHAAKTAYRINPANAPSPQMLALLPPIPGISPPEKIALLTSKYWGAKGVNLTVSFMDNLDKATRSKILLHANAWGKTANVVFTEVGSQGQVRISTREDGYWSYLGTDILHIPLSEPTMNLQGFNTSRTPDSEFYRVVRHEFGHTLGSPHEHMRTEIISRLDVQKTISYFQRTQGWDEQTTRQQVLTPIQDSDLTSLPSDVLSIMCYDLPGEITKDGQPIPGGRDIDEEDYTLISKLYPKSVSPPNPPNPPNPPLPPTPPEPPTPPVPPVPPQEERLFSLDFSARAAPRGTRIVFISPVDIPAEKLDVVKHQFTQGSLPYLCSEGAPPHLALPEAMPLWIEHFDWHGTLALCKWMLATFGPLAVPIVERYVADLPLSQEQKDMIDRLIESFLGPARNLSGEVRREQ